MRFSVASLHGSGFTWGVPPFSAGAAALDVRTMWEACSLLARALALRARAMQEACSLLASAIALRARGRRARLVAPLASGQSRHAFRCRAARAQSGAGAWCRESLSAAWASGSSAPWPQDLRRRHEVASRQRLDAGGPPRGWGRIGCRAPVWCPSDPDGGGRVGREGVEGGGGAGTGGAGRPERRQERKEQHRGGSI